MPKGIGLSPQQIDFCRLIADGYTQIEAYAKSHPQSKDWLPKTTERAGRRLFAQDRVKMKVEEFKLERLAKLARMRAESKEFITQVFVDGLDLLKEGIEIAKQANDYAAMIQASDKMSQAADRMGKFLGLNSNPDKEQNEDDKRLDELTDAELLRLVESQSNTSDTSRRAITSEARAA